MKNIKNDLTSFRIIMVMWFLSLMFTCAMFTYGLIYEMVILIIISGVTGVLSLIGIIYTGSLIIKINNSIKYFEEKRKTML